VRVLRVALAIVALLAAVIVGIGLLLRCEWHVSRSATVNAPPTTVYAVVSDLRRWSAWTVCADGPGASELDPTATWDVGEVAQGTGATLRWHGEKLGTGSLEITGGTPETGLAYTMLVEGFPSKGTLALAPAGMGTKVTWTDTGSVGWNLPARFFVATLEQELSHHFDRALAQLGTVMDKVVHQRADESRAAAQAAPSPTTLPLAAAPQ
jgi:hypothetical protein